MVAGMPANIFGAVEGERLRAEVNRACRIENVHCHVIAVRPNPDFRIIE